METTLQKGTKNALEMGRTFSTLFSDESLRMKLLAVESEFEFKMLLRQYYRSLTKKLASSDDEKYVDDTDGSHAGDSVDDDGDKRYADEDKIHADRISLNSRSRNKFNDSFKYSHLHKINFADQLKRVGCLQHFCNF